MKGVLSFLVFAVVLLVTTVRGSDWPQYQHDPQHSGRSNVPITPSVLRLAYSTSGGRPMIVDNTLYTTRPAGPTTITAYNLGDGTVKWTYTNSLFAQAGTAALGNIVAVFGYSDGVQSHLLVILDAVTGAVQYSVLVIGGNNHAVAGLTLAWDSTIGSLTAFCATRDWVTAVKLGANEGSVMWAQSGAFGGHSLPTVIGNSVIVAGPSQYYAIDRVAGDINHFHQGVGGGVGGVTVASDSARSQFYVLTTYSDTSAALSAYRYIDNENIKLLWQIQDDPFLQDAGSVAIGPDGKVYYCTPMKVAEVDPDSGTVLRSLDGDFASNVTPAISRGFLWVFSHTQTLAYDLNTFGLARALNGSRGDVDTAYSSPGAFKRNCFALDRLSGIDIYLQ